ncbi:hypothetical protein LTR85_003646 [Meristemomyces frigidus]|nr:hypothetical protein LTR85_003646 [Meristemomyces frigidus]
MIYFRLFASFMHSQSKRYGAYTMLLLLGFGIVSEMGKRDTGVLETVQPTMRYADVESKYPGEWRRDTPSTANPDLVAAAVTVLPSENLALTTAQANCRRRSTDKTKWLHQYFAAPNSHADEDPTAEILDFDTSQGRKRAVELGKVVNFTSPTTQSVNDLKNISDNPMYVSVFDCQLVRPYRALEVEEFAQCKAECRVDAAYVEFLYFGYEHKDGLCYCMTSVE